MLVEGEAVKVDSAVSKHPNPCAWFHYDDKDPCNVIGFLDSVEYFGLGASLQSLQELQQKHGPFCGVIGFSQGATMAHLLLQEPGWKLKFAVFYSGFLPASERSLVDSPAGQSLSTAHFLGLADANVAADLSKALAARYADSGNKVVYVHDKGHIVPQRAKDTKVVADFVSNAIGQLKAEKNKTSKTSKTSTQAHKQTAFFLAAEQVGEQEGATFSRTFKRQANANGQMISPQARLPHGNLTTAYQ